MIMLILFLAWLILGSLLLSIAYRSRRLAEADHVSAIERRARHELRDSEEALAEEVQAILKEEEAVS